MSELPSYGAKHVYILWKHEKVRRGKGIHQLTPFEKLLNLLIRLSETWPSFCTFYTNPAIHRTNNGTKKIIGMMKIRARTVHGYKTWPGMQGGLRLAGIRSN